MFRFVTMVKELLPCFFLLHRMDKRSLFCYQITLTSSHRGLEKWFSIQQSPNMTYFCESRKKAASLHWVVLYETVCNLHHQMAEWACNVSKPPFKYTEYRNIRAIAPLTQSATQIEWVITSMWLSLMSHLVNPVGVENLVEDVVSPNQTRPVRYSAGCLPWVYFISFATKPQAWNYPQVPLERSWS